MLKDEYKIASLIAKFLAEDIRESELQELEAWKKASDSNEALFNRLCKPEHIRELNEKASRYDKAEGWKNIEKHIKPERTLSLRKYLQYAASLILPAVICYFLLKNSNEEQTCSNTSPLVETIIPGSSKATLTLADGSVVDLENKKAFELQEKDGTKISKDSSILNYQATATVQQEVYNKIDIPKGGEYTLKLSDGSVVYLNAMSSLRFPVHFKGDKRVVELEGEAYFEVAKNAKPFIVKTQDMNIEVLGTVFNISCYAEDQATRTTLVSGKVKVTADCLEQPVILQPSQQASYYKSANRISVKEVDVNQYTAWKSGRFYFKDWRLEDIMNYLARWYDIDLFYQNNEIRNIKFGCNINRYGEINPILELLEQTGKISVQIKGKTIIFSNK